MDGRTEFSARVEPLKKIPLPADSASGKGGNSGIHRSYGHDSAHQRALSRHPAH